MNPTLQHLRRLALPLTAVAAASLLAACGGNSEPQTDNSLSTETAQSVGANSMVLGEDASSANAAVLSTAQAVVAGGQASQTYNCAGGGTALFTATGGSLGSLNNGVLDAGESYSLQFNACRSASGAAAVSGLTTLDVITASAGALTVHTSTQGIVVTQPQRTLTLNGSSTLSQTVVTNGASTTTTNRWTSPQIVLTSLRNARTSSLTLSNVDLTRTVITSGGVASGSSSSGTITIAVAWPNASWSATIATQGTAYYDANGMATQGSWLMSLPHDRIGLTVGSGLATLTIDFGADGSIDRTYVFGVSALADGSA